jgi:signal transduction histidine kinase
MTMVSSVVVFAFVVIFATIYTREHNENNEKLMFALPARNLTVSAPTLMQGNYIYSESGEIGGTGEAGEPVVTATHITSFARRISPDAGLSFSIFMDSQNKIYEVDSMVDLDDKTYAMMADKAMATIDDPKRITMDGRVWQYIVSPITMISREVHNPTSMVVVTSEELNHIRFLDVTDSSRMIRSMAFTLTGLIVAILVIFFFISRFFANRAIRPMEEAWEKQSRFITDASHELKTPLSVISANCGVLYEGKEETVGSQLKWVDSIMRATDRMAGLVSYMMSLVSMEDIQLELKSTLFDLSKAVSDAADEIEAPLLEKGLTIQRDIEPGVEIESDRVHIGRVLSILLDNAVKYTNNSGYINISLVKDNHKAICMVRNSGEGIPAEDLPRLFDRFYRGDPARASTTVGYGLGLSIANAIAKQLGAKLSVNSAPGEYTEFSFTVGC